ncbi:MAG: 50S ribosomal protein L24 [bacterium]|nr:50S ribosomal protein L24 [bacterium]
MKIKKGDTVKIISGKDRGKTGKVLKVFLEDERMLVEGVNMRKKHERAKRQDKKGEVITRPAPISVANAMLVCPKCSKPARVGYQISGKQKARICKKCGAEI